MKLAKTWFDVEKRKCNSQMTSMSPRSTLCFFLTCFDLNEEIPSWHIDIWDSMFLSIPILIGSLIDSMYSEASEMV